MRRIVVVVVAVMSLVAASVPAGADTATFSDANDSPGRLDIKTLAHGHTDTGRLRHTIRMHDRWTNRAMRGGGVHLGFDTDGDRYAEREMWIDYKDNKLVAEMWNENWDVVGYAKVWRSDERTLKVAFPRRLLRRGLEAYRWNARTAFARPTHDDCWEREDVVMTCYDYAPDHDRRMYALRHVLR